MSIELNIYSFRPVLSRETLARECRSPDLPKDMRWEIFFIRPAEDQADPDQIGPLTGDQRIVGWNDLLKDVGQLRAAIVGNDKKILDQMYESEAYASVDLSVLTPDSAEWTSLAEPDALEGIPEKFQDTIRKSSSFYILRTHACRNDQSLELQQHLWRMIGVLTGGIIEDPQEGEVVDCAEEGDNS